MTHRMWARPPQQHTTNQQGFSTVELLSTLVIAAIFITIFYQLYVTINIVATRANHLALANEATYGKLQQYENTDFQDITTPGGVTSAEVEDFSASLPTALPSPRVAKVSTALLTPTLKAVNVKTTFGQDGAAQIIEYTVYLQESGVGR